MSDPVRPFWSVRVSPPARDKLTITSKSSTLWKIFLKHNQQIFLLAEKNLLSSFQPWNQASLTVRPFKAAPACDRGGLRNITTSKKVIKIRKEKKCYNISQQKRTSSGALQKRKITVKLQKSHADWPELRQLRLDIRGSVEAWLYPPLLFQSESLVIFEVLKPVKSRETYIHHMALM